MSSKDMKNILIYSDLHINKQSLEECSDILVELTSLINKYNVDTVINCGDTFDRVNPSPEEQDLFSKFLATTPNQHHIVIAANSHESTTETISVLNHYGILADNVEIVKEFNDDYMYCGHFILNESKINYGATKSKKDFPHKYVFLGHQHIYELIPPNICHIGSVRFKNFDEVAFDKKIICLIQSYQSEHEDVHFLKLKSPYPMKLVEFGLAGTDTETIKYIDNIDNLISLYNTLIDKNYKIKTRIYDYKLFSDYLNIKDKYTQSFNTFIYDIKFDIVKDKNIEVSKNAMVTLKDAFDKYKQINKIPENIETIIKNNINI